YRYFFARTLAAGGDHLAASRRACHAPLAAQRRVGVAVLTCLAAEQRFAEFCARDRGRDMGPWLGLGRDCLGALRSDRAPLPERHAGHESSGQDDGCGREFERFMEDEATARRGPTCFLLSRLRRDCGADELELTIIDR